MISASFNVSLKNDNILESNETFKLAIDPSSLPNSVTVGDPGETTVTILDNDGEYNLMCSCRKQVATLKVRFNLNVPSYKLPAYKHFIFSVSLKSFCKK